MHWKLTLAYDGTNFHGWQVQPGLPTIQGTLAAALHHILGETVLPQGSGRTDTGVHALAQVASFTLAAAIPPANLQRALNRVLPPSIRVLSAEHAPPAFHARHSALRKTYEYRIFPRIPTLSSSFNLDPDTSVPHSSRTCDEWDVNSQSDNICPPPRAPYVWDCPWPISLPLAQQASDHILGEHDFTSFAAVNPDQTHRNPSAEVVPNNTRTIFDSLWTQTGGILLYRVTGSGFLHHMVRNLVGTFVAAAAGRIPPDSIPRILAARSRSAAGATAPARGLFLVSVEY
jgi:tRNA pseudouridine38-40 synthase